MGSHIIFVADICDCGPVARWEPATYAYCHNSIKPKPAAEIKKGFRYKVCGYFYEGDFPPPDFQCPVCKHPASDFGPAGGGAEAERPDSLSGSRAEANLKAAFAGEPQARNKYTVFASRARGEGYGVSPEFSRKRPPTSSPMPLFGPASLAGREIPRKTSNRRPTEKITSGPTCTRALPQTPGRRVLPK